MANNASFTPLEMKTIFSTTDPGLSGIEGFKTTILVKDNRGSDTVAVKNHRNINIPKENSSTLNPINPDTLHLNSNEILSTDKSLDQLIIKNNFTKNLLGYFITSQHTQLAETGVQSITYFSHFSGKKIASVRFVRLHPFGSSLEDTTMVATKWIEKSGNRLHMNTAKYKLRMQLLFKAGETLNPLLMAENEKLMRDLNYIEDVAFLVEPSENNSNEVNVVVISKDKFEYAVSMSLNADNSDVEVVNENMFGLGHRFNFGMAQKNTYLPEMGIYFSYHINNIFGHFINSTVGYSNTYLKKGWNVSAEKKFLTSQEVNVGGFSYEHVAKYNYIAEDHPIQLDTTVSYEAADLWFLHAIPSKGKIFNKTILSIRYYHQEFTRRADDSFGQSEFLRNHDFLMAGISFTKRNLYKNNLIYGYGVTEDIPYGHYYALTSGLDKSQFGIWPYLNLSLSNAWIDKEGRYYCGRFSVDGFFDQGMIKQGTVLLSGDYFSKKFYAFGDPFRQFVKIEFLGGINRFKEEYLTIDGRFGIRDFYAHSLRGTNRLRFNFETVRYLKWNFYGFKFTNYVFTDFAFLSDKASSILTQDFYAGVGSGFRIYNESLVFKIIDIRLTWFPLMPPDGMSSFGANLQGLTKSSFDDFLGRKPEVVRFQ